MNAFWADCTDNSPNSRPFSTGSAASVSFSLELIATRLVVTFRGDLGVDATANQGEVIQAVRESCREYLRTGKNFAFNATNTMRQTRKRWIDLFADYLGRIELVYVEPPLPTIFHQNERRAKPVPKQVIQRLVEKLEPPTWAEAHSLTLTSYKE